MNIEEEIGLLCQCAGEIANSFLEVTENKSAWRHDINPKHLNKIYIWIKDNKNKILERIKNSPSGRTGLFSHKETGLAVTLDIVIPREASAEVIFKTKINLTNDNNNEGLKEKKTDKPRSNILQQGCERIVKKCLHWNSSMTEPEPYVAKVSEGLMAIEFAKKEEIISYIIGDVYASPTCLGSPRIKNNITITTVYSPQAIGDFFDWPEPGISFSSLMLTIYQNVLIMSFMHRLNMIWRDLKPENFLCFLVDKNIAPKTTDFTTVIWPGDTFEMEGAVGSYRYHPPESNEYLSLREAKVNALREGKNPTNISSISQELNECYTKLADPHHCENYTDFLSAATLIYKTQEIKNLLPSGDDSNGETFIFSPSPADDVYAFCKWINIFFAPSVKQFTFEQKETEVFQNIYKFFSDNMNVFRNSRCTSEKILLFLESEMRKIFKESDEIIKNIGQFKIQAAECLKSAEIRMRTFPKKLPIHEATDIEFKSISNKISSKWLPTEWPSSLTQDQKTLLFVQTSNYGNMTCLQKLLDMGADINGMACFSNVQKLARLAGQTALHAAAWRRGGDDIIVKFLLENGCDIYKKNGEIEHRRPELAIFSHIEAGNSKSVEMILEKADELKRPLLEERNCVRHNYTPLLMSLNAIADYPDVVHLLLERKADINAKSSSGESAVMICVKSNRLNSLAHVLKSPQFNCNMLDFRDDEGNTALHIAVLHHMTMDGQADLISGAEKIMGIISLLLEAGADIEAKNNQKESPKDRIIKQELLIKHSQKWRVGSDYLRAKLELLNKIINTLDDWRKLLVDKSDRMCFLQNLSFFPSEALKIISDYDIHPPAVDNVSRLSIFKTKQNDLGSPHLSNSETSLPGQSRIC